MSYDTSDKKCLFAGYFVEVFQGMFGHEVVVGADSVACLIYVRDRREFMMVKQPRAPMVTQINPEGLIKEAIAGRFTKEDARLTATQLMIKEAEEEAEILILAEQIHIFNGGRAMAVSPGVSTEKMTLGLAIIDSSQVEGSDRIFGVDDHEKTTRVRIPINEARGMIFEDMKTCLVMSLSLEYLKGL